MANGEVRTLGRVEARESRRSQVTAGADGWIRRMFTAARAARWWSRESRSRLTTAATSPRLNRPISTRLDAQQRLPPRALRRSRRRSRARQLTQARDYLEYLGLTAPQIADLGRSRQEGREVTLGAPASGIVLERNVSEGARFDRGDVLWEIGDIESVWITADLFPEDLHSIAGARSATVILPGGVERQAAVDSSLPRFENAARVAMLRLIADNRNHRLLPGMTVTVTLRALRSKA